MPMLTTLRIGLPVWPRHSPARTVSANSAIRSSTSCTAGHDVDAVDLGCARRVGARSATCSTARSSVTLIFSPANIASMRSRRPDSLGQLDAAGAASRR